MVERSTDLFLFLDDLFSSGSDKSVPLSGSVALSGTVADISGLVLDGSVCDRMAVVSTSDVLDGDATISGVWSEGGAL